METAADVIQRAYTDWVGSDAEFDHDYDFGRFATLRLLGEGFDVHRFSERPQPFPTAEPRQEGV